MTLLHLPKNEKKCLKSKRVLSMGKREQHCELKIQDLSRRRRGKNWKTLLIKEFNFFVLRRLPSFTKRHSWQAEEGGWNMKVCINIVKYENKLVRAGSLGMCCSDFYTLLVRGSCRSPNKMSSYQNCRISVLRAEKCSQILFNDASLTVDIGLIGSTLNTSNYTHARLSSLVRRS